MGLGGGGAGGGAQGSEFPFPERRQVGRGGAGEPQERKGRGGERGGISRALLRTNRPPPHPASAQAQRCPVQAHSVRGSRLPSLSAQEPV